MRTLRYFCDRCGTEIVQKQLCRVGFEYDDEHFPHSNDVEYSLMEDYQDLCPDCIHKITKFIMNKEDLT